MQVTVSGAGSLVAPAADVTAAARAVYAALDAGTSPVTPIADVLGALLPVLKQGDEALSQQLINEGHPFVLDVHASLLADAYRQGSLTTLDSFIRAAVEAGARREDGGALTRQYLTTGLAPLLARAEFGGDEIVAALVLALGRERASRYPQAATDPVWGDGWLDPLQTLLLLYSFHFSSTPSSNTAMQVSSTASTPPLPGWVRSLGAMGVRGFIAGLVGRMVEMPLTVTQAARASVCASILMYGHKFAVTADRNEIHYLHRSGTTLPHRSEITAALTFDFVPNAFGASVLSRIGCELPPLGPAVDRTVEWTVRDPLPNHGSLRDQQARTDAQGKARAAYEAIDEIWPPELRGLEQSVSGTIDIRATGLVPGWRNLERAVGVGVLNPTDAGVRLAVQYHEPPPAFDVSLTTRLQASVVTGGSFNLAGTVQGRIVLKDGWRELKRVLYEGTPRFEYTTVSGPACISGGGTIPTTWAGISGPIGVSLFQQARSAPGSNASLNFHLSAPPTGIPPSERVTCAGTPVTERIFMSLWSFARLNLQDPLAGGIRNWTVVSQGVIRAEINGPFLAPGFTNTSESTVITLTAVSSPSGQTSSGRRP